MTIAPGTDVLLGKRYRLVSRIAAGGMGEVWSATDEVLGRNVAVKVLRREYAADPVFRERFRAEARHTAALSHAGIAAVYDYYDGSAADGTAGQSPFLVMENVPGEALSRLLAREGAVAEGRTLELIGSVSLALQAAHDAGVIHRDVKPGNILLMPDGTVKITDFGIARATNSAPLTATGAMMGTAFYVSPEQAAGKRVTPATDVYSLGVVAYECLTGRRPFEAETPVGVALAHVRDEPAALGDGISPEVSALVMRMLAKDPANRPSSAGELAQDSLALRATLAAPSAAARTMPATPLTTAEPAVTRVAGGWDSKTDPDFRLPAPGRTPRWAPYAVALGVCALVLLFVVHGCATGGNETTASTSKPAPSSTVPVGVLVRAADYLGKPVAEATAAVRALGLTVSLRPGPASPGAPIGTVTGVTPTGRLNPGSTVTLEVAQAPAGQEKEHKHKRHKPPGHDNVDGKQGNP